MHGRFRSKARAHWAVRLIGICVLVCLFSAFSMVSVMANTVSATVIDGGESYTFSMDSKKLESVLAQAEGRGLAPLGPLDVAERVENTTTVNVRRGVRMQVTEAGQVKEFIAYKGDTVRKALQENNILVKDSDTVVPSRDLMITEDICVDVKRSCEVTVTGAGIQEQKISMIGGTVADALAEAKVKLKAGDTCNYSLEEPLFDKMKVRIIRAGS